LRGRDGLGGGDAKLAAAAGAWLGAAALPTVIFLAAVSGLVMALGLRVSGRKVGGEVKLPFGPPLCTAIWIIWLYDIDLGWLVAPDRF
jgi:leader peptidase (prepilin peptidase)/N-methyltransferase